MSEVYIKKSDMEKILYSTNNVVRIGELFTELPTYSFSDSAENKGEWLVVADSYHEDGTIYESHWECSKCGSGRSGWGEFKYCPDCGADMRPKPYKAESEGT